jgi:hypothetical protein
MSSTAGQVLVGSCLVQTVDNRGWTTDEVAERALDKLITVSESAPPIIRAQAEAYKNQIRSVLIHYMREAIASDRATLAVKLQALGHADLIKLLS